VPREHSRHCRLCQASFAASFAVVLVPTDIEDICAAVEELLAPYGEDVKAEEHLLPRRYGESACSGKASGGWRLPDRHNAVRAMAQMVKMIPLGVLPVQSAHGQGNRKKAKFREK